MPEPRRIVVVGTGVAGATAALTLRKDGFDGQIVLAGEDPELPYRRPALSKELLDGTATPERISLKPAATWDDLDIDLMVSARVDSIGGGAVTFTGGNSLRYDRLLLATGSAPRPLSLASGLPHVHTLRTLADASALRTALVPDASLVVVGAGLVGLEVAATARRLGCRVTVLEAMDRPLARVLPPALADAVADLHRSEGVELLTSTHLQALRPLNSGVEVTASGQTRQADAVLIAVGTCPRTRLAERAGLLVSDGVIVDAYGRTSEPDIFAAGDVARYPDPSGGGMLRGEHWNHAQDHGALAAANMLGADRPYNAVPWCWTKQYGVTVQICGHPTDADHLDITGDPHTFDFTALAHRNGHPIAAVAAGRPAAFRKLRTSLTPTTTPA
ncbi:NAD(P)/FAD-dependent oxidoreductase [Actinomadura rupiterrae]|uniref:NAD(P)/FAD-dependent oxidoreductase n=1 Tax=Actinomadura rupiterrae TaxID=559627 RepID=UPI0020A47AFC|nr:FAD-dependent oxidoreductase [Actinomadura rupiterrae]MCP2342274.1 NADPH-dependent 2,4-dienoyl-CoA reductase/sulfur reductase-like enzyme [Actinomadura rupiterrae]